MNLMKLIIKSIMELIHLLLYEFSCVLSSRSYYYVCPIRLKSKTFQLISEYLTIILTKFTEYIIIFNEI